MTSICAKKKRKECDDLLNHINKIKVLIDQFSLFGFTYEKWRCYHDFAREFATLIRTLEHCIRDYADEGVDCGIHDDIFARNVQKEEERTRGVEIAMVSCQGKWNHLHTKTSRRDTIVANRATLCVFYYNVIIKNKKCEQN